MRKGGQALSVASGGKRGLMGLRICLYPWYPAQSLEQVGLAQRWLR